MGMDNKSKKVRRAETKLFSIREKEVDANGISFENHLQMTSRLVAAGLAGIHNPPTKKPKS